MKELIIKGVRDIIVVKTKEKTVQEMPFRTWPIGICSMKKITQAKDPIAEYKKALSRFFGVRYKELYRDACEAVDRFVELCDKSGYEIRVEFME